eukprot:m.160928 g.160928  ORF g.160928 m.160928 type:complete len:120 (+) comp15179_c0_seq4:237-596(+)
MASLIGIANAPSWKGPYTMGGVYGGSISTQNYPYDENEDPFLWSNSRGWHALFHANTWSDSRNVHHPVAEYAGRHAYSVDGVVWTYTETPCYTGAIKYNNGSTKGFYQVSSVKFSVSTF